MASMLFDVPYKVGQDTNSTFPCYRQTWLFFFVSDKWQVGQKLTLDLGLRYELYPPATPRKAGGFVNYNPSQQFTGDRRHRRQPFQSRDANRLHKLCSSAGIVLSCHATKPLFAPDLASVMFRLWTIAMPITIRSRPAPATPIPQPMDQRLTP